MSINQSKHCSAGNTFGTELLRLVSFNIGEELFAVDILRVQEINRMMSLTQMPQSLPGVCGMINLRGRIVPVLSLRERMGIENIEHSGASRIIVVDINGSTVGFIVDAVHEVLQIDPSTIDPKPAISSTEERQFVFGVAKLEKTLLILLDLDQLMSAESLETIGASKPLAA